MALVLRSDCCPCVNENNPCAQKLSISYDWSANPSRDLDTGTDFLGTKVGWSCGSGDAYIQWTSGDNTSASGIETVEVDVGKAHADGRWTSSVNVSLCAGWYLPAEGSGAAVVSVRYCGQPEQTKSISPGTQSNCASSGVGTVTIYDDGTFALS